MLGLSVCAKATEEVALGQYLDLLMDMLVAVLVIAVLCVAFYIAVYWRLYRKAGEPGWAAIVPILNGWVLYKITWGKGHMYFVQVGVTCVLSILGNILWPFSILSVIAGLIFTIVTNVKLAKAFGKGGGFAFGLIVLPIIFLPMLAFGSAEYDPAAVLE